LVRHKQMSIYVITHEIEASSVQKATAMRDKCAAYLEDEDVRVIHSNVGAQGRRFKVVGVDVAGKAPFCEEVQAEDREAAAKQVASSTKVVAEVTPAP
jgi:hypothetical protein